MNDNVSFTTVVLGQYLVLAPFFIKSVRNWQGNVPIFLLVESSEFQRAERFLKPLLLADNIELIETHNVQGIPNDMETQGCARKLLIWSWLPNRVTRTILIDIDTVIVGNLIKALRKVPKRVNYLCLARDNYVGYKERIGEEFEILGRDWKPSFDNKGRRKYCNTGLIMCNREHQSFFNEVLDEWRLFVRLTGVNPSIWDQNVFNYCLDVGSFSCSWDDVCILDEPFNVLKEYEVVIDLDRSIVSLSGERVIVLHFNGGDIITKFSRRAKAIQLIFE